MICGQLRAQSPDDLLKIKEANIPYLENLIKEKLDSARRSSVGARQTANDSLLYVVAKQHADYLSVNNKSGHNQLEDSMRTTALRLKHFGVQNYLSSELVQSTYAHRPVKIKPNPNEKLSIKTIFDTYNDVAYYFVSQWSQAKRTKSKFNDPNYNVVGIAVTINKLNDNIKVVAILGRPFLKYKFTENKEMFPYSTFEQQETLRAHKDVAGNYVTDRPYKIKETSDAKCKKCDEMLEGIDFKMSFRGPKVYVSSNATEGLQKFLSSNKNGLMLEVLEYEDYHPGNPEYYEKPTRRNKMFIYNGDIQLPVLGDKLITGLKLEKNSFKAYLGKKPRTNIYYEINVYVIYKNLLCGIVRFPQPIGDPLALYKFQDMEYDLTNDYNYKYHADTLDKKIEFKDSSFSSLTTAVDREVANFEEEHKDKTDVEIDVVINEPIAFYREEDEEPLNYEKIADSLLQDVKNHFADHAKIVVKKEKNLKALQEYFKESGDEEKSAFTIEQFEEFFKEEENLEEHKDILRKSYNAHLYVVTYIDKVVDLTGKYIELKNKLDTTLVASVDDLKSINELHTELLKESLLHEIPLDSQVTALPVYKLGLEKVLVNQITHNYNSIDENELTKDTLQYFYIGLKKAFKLPSSSATIKQNFLKFSCNHMAKRPYDSQYRSNVLTKLLGGLEGEIPDEQFKELSEAYDVKLAYYYSFYEKAKAKFEKSIDKMNEKYSNGSDEDKYKLALTLVYFGKNDKAQEVIQPFLGSGSTNVNMLVLNNKLNQEYTDVFGNEPTGYYDILIGTYDQIGQEQWCKQFVGAGNISFQAFDYVPLYHKYCDECATVKNEATELKY